MSPDDIDKLTIAEVRAIAERASESLKQLRELQALLGMRSPIGVAPVAAVISPPGFVPLPASPFPCAACGRAAPERLSEPTQPEECLQCGNHLPLVPGSPAVLMTNKGPIVPITAAERAAAIGMPAFDANGEPT